MKELKALMRFAKPYRWFIVLATVSMIAVTGMNLLAPWMIRNLISTVTGGTLTESNIRRVSILALITIVVYLIRAVSQFGSNYVSHYAAWKILESIRQHLYDHIQHLSLRYFQDKQTGDLMSRIINDTRNFEHLLAHAIPTIIVNLIMIIGVSSILFSINITLALYTLIPMPVLIYMVLKFSKISRSRFKDAQKKIGEVNSILQDNFSGIKEIKAFTHETYESKRTGESITGHTKAILKALKLSNSFHPGIDFVSSIGTVIVIFFGGKLALSGTLPIEDLVAFLLYLGSFYHPITALGNINEGLQQALASAERVLEVLSEESEIKEDPQPVELGKAKGQIEFSNVDFHYVDNIPVLKNISFKIKPGETLAIVGPTGVGKTTSASLMLRFFDPVSGKILLDDTDIRKISLSSLRRQATSSVDTQTEKLIQDALNKLKKNKTTIVIAHRLSTIQDADQIIVMKEGVIVERGKHKELLKLNGLYSELCKAQSTLQQLAVS